VEDLLQPDYEGMKRFIPIINKFKDTFFEGNEEDPECAPIKGRGRGGGKPGGAKLGGKKGDNSAFQHSQSTAANKGRDKKQMNEAMEDDNDRKLPSSQAVLKTNDKKRKEPPQK